MAEVLADQDQKVWDVAYNYQFLAKMSVAGHPDLLEFTLGLERRLDSGEYGLAKRLVAMSSMHETKVRMLGMLARDSLYYVEMESWRHGAEDEAAQRQQTNPLPPQV